MCLHKGSISQTIRGVVRNLERINTVRLITFVMNKRYCEMIFTWNQQNRNCQFVENKFSVMD